MADADGYAVELFQKRPGAGPSRVGRRRPQEEDHAATDRHAGRAASATRRARTSCPTAGSSWSRPTRARSWPGPRSAASTTMPTAAAAQRLHARHRRGALHHPERRDRRRVAGRGHGPPVHPEGLAGRAGRGGRRRGRRHPAAGAQRPDLRTGRAPLLHRPRGLPARTIASRAASSRWSRTGRASSSRRSRAPTRTASPPSPTGRSSGWSRTSGASIASARAMAVRADRPAARGPHPRRPEGRRRTATCGSPRSWAAAVDILDARRHDPSTSSRPAASRSTASSTTVRPDHHRLRRHHRGHGPAPDGWSPVAGRVGVEGMPLFRGSIAARS